MSWGTSFKPNIYLNRLVFNDKSELEDMIEEYESYISNSIEKIKMFAVANIKDIIDPEWVGEPITWLNNQINDLMDSIKEFSYEVYMLKLYLDYINDECDGVIPKIEK
jgi:hypothetical protein